jgi:prepilin-type N-terminal cleavage/methylation domain-containing protein
MKGFTVLELLIVLAIAGIVAVLLITGWGDFNDWCNGPITDMKVWHLTILIWICSRG